MNEKRRRGFGRDFWVRHVEKYKASGLNQSKYASEHGLKHQSLGAWINRLAREGSGAGSPRKQGRDRSREAVDGTFAKVVVAPDYDATLAPQRRACVSDMRLTFPGGVVLELAPRFDAVSVAQLIAAVGGGR